MGHLIYIVHMKMYVMFFIFLLFVLILNVAFSQLDEDDCFKPSFTRGTEACSGFDNELFVCDLHVEVEENAGGMILSGKMEVTEDLGDEYEIGIKIFKDLGTGNQFMYSMEGNLCDSLKKNDTPWRPLVEALQTTDCPIVKEVYPVEQMRLSLDFAKNVMKREFCADYMVEISLGKLNEEARACYEIGLTVECDSCD